MAGVWVALLDKEMGAMRPGSLRNKKWGLGPQYLELPLFPLDLIFVTTQGNVYLVSITILGALIPVLKDNLKGFGPWLLAKLGLRGAGQLAQDRTFLSENRRQLEWVG